VNEPVGADYIARTQMSGYDLDPSWNDPATHDSFVEINKLRFLRPYQIKAVKMIQRAAAQGKDCFLFEMARQQSCRWYRQDPGRRSGDKTLFSERQRPAGAVPG